MGFGDGTSSLARCWREGEGYVQERTLLPWRTWTIRNSYDAQQPRRPRSERLQSLVRLHDTVMTSRWPCTSREQRSRGGGSRGLERGTGALASEVQRRHGPHWELAAGARFLVFPLSGAIGSARAHGATPGQTLCSMGDQQRVLRATAAREGSSHKGSVAALQFCIVHRSF